MITIAIATYNRRELLEKSINSLLQSNDLSQCNIRIYDDCSSQLSIEEIKTIIPQATITRRPKNLGADKNCYLMYKDFLNTEDDIFVNADADLLYHPEWLTTALALLEKTDGVISLYNSINHNHLSTLNMGGNDLLIKKSLGAAGTIFTRATIMKIVESMDENSSNLSFDWKWSALLRKRGLQLYCTKRSYIQHIGNIGQNNSSLANADYGINFIPGNDLNSTYLEQFYHGLLKSKLDDSLDYKIGHLVLTIPRKIKKILENIIHTLRV